MSVRASELVIIYLCISVVLVSLLSSLCALRSSLLGADPFLYHPTRLRPNHSLLRLSHLVRACLFISVLLSSCLTSFLSLVSLSVFLLPLFSSIRRSAVAVVMCLQRGAILTQCLLLLSLRVS